MDNLSIFIHHRLFITLLLGSNAEPVLVNPIALGTARTALSFRQSKCDRVR